jgi:hypothetical protein
MIYPHILCHCGIDLNAEMAAAGWAKRAIKEAALVEEVDFDADGGDCSDHLLHWQAV